MLEMMKASFLQIWHLIPIAIGIILFKMFLNSKSKKRSIEVNEQHEKNGLTLELRAGKKYEEMGYDVVYNEQKSEDEIDLLCSRDDKTLLIQCNKNSNKRSISYDDIMSFIDNAKKYLKLNDIEAKGVEFRYVILYPEVLDKSAMSVFTDDSNKCKYMIL